MARKARTSGVSSVALEEDIPVPYSVVGSREWIDGWFQPDALREGKVVPIAGVGDLAEVKASLAKRPRLGCDTETASSITGIAENSKFDDEYRMEPWHPSSEIVMFQIGAKDCPYIVEPRLIPEFRSFLESDQWLKVLQNSVFDFKMFLAKYGVHLVRLFDTMLAEQLLTAGRSGLRVTLLDLARRYQPYRIIRKDVRDTFMEFRPGIDKFNRDQVYYAGRDIVLLDDIVDGQIPELQKWKLEEVARAEFNCVPCTAEMELWGVYIEVAVLELALTYYRDRDVELREQIMSRIGETLAESNRGGLGLFGKDGFHFDIKSSAQRLEVFRDMLGFDISDVTRDTMKDLPHEAGPLIGEWTGVDKVNTTYGEGMIGRISPYDRRLHPRFSQLGMGDADTRSGKKDTIATGRYSSNFQQLPKPVERFARVKDLGELHIVEMQFADKLAQFRAERGLANAA